MADKKYESLKIENIVASGVIADSIDLVDVSSKIKSCELNTKRFPGAVYRIEKPKIASLIFSSGKVVLTGIRDKKALTEGLRIIMKSLKEAGVDTYKEPKVAITPDATIFSIFNDSYFLSAIHYTMLFSES